MNRKTNRRNKPAGKPETAFWTKDENGSHILDTKTSEMFLNHISGLKADVSGLRNYLRGVYTHMSREAVSKNIAGQIMTDGPVEIYPRVANAFLAPGHYTPEKVKIFFDFTQRNADKGIIFIRPKYQGKTEPELKTA